MSLKINTEQLCSREVICHTTQDQQIELDYVLPDYFPEIFRIIRCTASPAVISCSVNGDRLSYELCVTLKIIYCGTGSALRTIERKLNYSRSVDLDHTGICPAARITPTTDYINCRAVTSRRVDIRGALGISVTVTAESAKEVVSDVFGDDVLLKKKTVSCPSPLIYSEKRITVSEVFGMGEAKPPVLDILRCSAAVMSSDSKIIANKLAAKGELKINMLYTGASDDSENAAPEAMQFTLPFSQIMDMDGLDERCEVSRYISVLSCEVRPRSDGSGDAREVECEVILLIACSARKYNEITAVVDEYSLTYPTEHVTESVKLCCPPVSVSQNRIIKGTAEHREGTLDRIYDAWCEVSSCESIREEDGSLTLSGKASCYCMAGSSKGETVICTADVPFRFEGVSAAGFSPDVTAQLEAVPVNCSYNLTSDNSVEIKAELRICGEVTDSVRIDAITSVTADEENPLTPVSDAAIKLCYASKGEDLWNIAKQCRASAEAIMLENDLEAPVTEADGLIIIPIQ